MNKNRTTIPGLRFIGICCLATSLIVAAATANPMAGRIRRQEPSGSAISLRSDLVTVSVGATDKHGKAVSGLAREDFEILDNDRRRPIVAFSTESGSAAITRPISLLLLIDSSGSIAATLGQQRSAAASFIASLGDQSRIAIVEFAGQPREILGLTNDKAKASDALAELRAVGGSTAILDAILAGFNVLSTDTDPASQKVVVVISDGLDTASHAEPYGCIRRADEMGASVYGIHVPLYAPADGRLVPRQASRGWLEVVAATGGKVWRAGTAKEAIDPRAQLDLSPIFNLLVEELRSQYVLGFHPEERAARGYHALKIRVKHPAVRRTRHRFGYWLAKP